MYHTVYDYGPPWCECTMPQPSWLAEEHPDPWRRVEKALVLGPPEGDYLSEYLLGFCNRATSALSAWHSGSAGQDIPKHCV